VAVRLSEHEAAVLSSLSQLAYFARNFDLKARPSAGAMERSAALAWDAHLGQPDPLTEADLDALTTVGSLLSSRDSLSTHAPPVSHEEAVEVCGERARRWLHGPDAEAEPECGPAYTRACLRARRGLDALLTPCSGPPAQPAGAPRLVSLLHADSHDHSRDRRGCDVANQGGCGAAVVPIGGVYEGSLLCMARRAFFWDAAPGGMHCM